VNIVTDLEIISTTLIYLFFVLLGTLFVCWFFINRQLLKESVFEKRTRNLDPDHSVLEGISDEFDQNNLTEDERCDILSEEV